MHDLKCLEIYMAVKLHFTTVKYNLFDSAGRVGSITLDNFNKNPGRRALIQRCMKRFKTYPEYIHFLVANYAYGDGTSLYSTMLADENYEKWKKFRISSTQKIIEDLRDVDLEAFIMGTEPAAFRDVVSGKVHIESVAALNRIVDFIEPENYLVFGRTALIIKKLDRFVKFDKEKVCRELELNHEVA